MSIALHHYLAPLAVWLNDPAVSEVSINAPEEVFIERGGMITQHHVAALHHYWLQGLADLIARFSGQRLSEVEPLLSAQLPGGHRIQIIIPPACEPEKIILSIRKQVLHDMSLDEYTAMNAFTNTKPHPIKSHRQHVPSDADDELLAELFSQGDYLQFLKLAITTKKNILISGGTSTGKTTLLNACLKEIPHDERIITLEDVREVNISHHNTVHLLASKGEQGTAKATMTQLIEASLRLRPDRIILGELRGKEAADFINATATGHDGSISSIHASSPTLAFMRLVHMVKLNPAMNLSRDDILADLHHLIDVVVQIKRVRVDSHYQRTISEIYSAFNHGD